MYEYVGPDRWARTTVYDLARWKNGLAFKSKDFTESGRPVIKIAELKSGISNQTKLTDGEYDERVLVKKCDMLFSWSGNPDTSIDVFRWDGPEGWLNQHIYKVTPQEGVDEDFLFFVLRWLRPRFAEIARNKQTTGLGHVTLQDFKNMAVGLPDVEEQRAIVSYVIPVQEKIELNLRMNETLGAMAREIFKDWFVEFGPTRAKADDRAPYLAPEIWELFPDVLDGENKPKGWAMQTVASCAVKIQNGGTPRRSEDAYWTDGTVPWLSSGEVRQDIIIETENYITELGLQRSSAKMVPEKSILVALYGATAGQVALSAIPLTTNQAICAIVPRDGFRYFLLMHFKCKVESLAESAVGSAQQNISKKIVEELATLVPTNDCIFAFERAATPLFDRIVANLFESKRLAEVRDVLLPKLMSGDIDLREARKEMEGVA